MIAADFITKWRSADLTERAAAQSHFCELCALLEEQTPTDADPKGDWYAFEKGATKTTGGEGWADVWKRGCFGWEYKSRGKDLRAAFAQLQRYAPALENPPLLVVCDLARFEIHTNWTNTVSHTYEIGLDELADSRKLRWLNFCMFAEDVDLLPGKMFGRMLDSAARSPGEFEALASSLFAAMREGGRIGFERVDWFNGGLFDDDNSLPLTREDIALVREAAARDWTEIDPTIFGTLFERGLDPDKRSQMGAHYTDRDKIMLIVEPVIVRPWLAEWAATKAVIAGHIAAADEARARRPTRQADASRVYNAARRAEEGSLRAARAVFDGFMQRSRAFRVLDPACGSGNFLYLALLALKDIEHRVAIEAEELGLGREFPRIGPEAVKGIEINPYAAELARVTVWIGEIQWMRRNGFDVGRNPILKPLDTIECRDAILNEDGTEAEWPVADVVISNPPFLGETFMRSRLGSEYTKTLRSTYSGRVRGGADLVCYWFDKARKAVANSATSRAGLVATNSIRGGANRVVLDRISEQLNIFDAWSDEEWTVDGAAVRVSLIAFARKSAFPDTRLNGSRVSQVYADLTAGSANLTLAIALVENSGVCFEGCKKYGAFDITGEIARGWLTLPVNPNGHGNAYVIRPWLNAMDVVRRSSDTWAVDFNDMSIEDASLFEAPFEYALSAIKPFRDQNRRNRRRIYWWQHGETIPGLRRAIQALDRYIVTPVVAKHRLFVWVSAKVLPSNLLDVIARDDDTAFGILHSRLHEAWALRLGTSLEDRPRYTPSTTFETFPFPDGLTPNRPAGEYADDPRAVPIAAAAHRLNELREAWLNPSDLVERVPEVVSGFPDRIVPVSPKAAAILKRRALTYLYNERPTWLDNAHRELDAAVAAAYGWPADIAEEEALARLLELNHERAAAGR